MQKAQSLKEASVDTLTCPIVDKHVQALMTLNQALLALRAREELRVPKGNIVSHCFNAVKDAAAGAMGALKGHFSSIAMRVMADEMSEELDDQHAAIHSWVHHVSLAEEVFCEVWGWSKEETAWQAFLCVHAMDVCLWGWPNYDLDTMCSEAVLDASGKLQAVLRFRDSISAFFDKAFADAFHTWSTSCVVQDFNEEVVRRTMQCLEGDTKPFQEPSLLNTFM